jgi:hypothetical protein
MCFQVPFGLAIAFFQIYIEFERWDGERKGIG